MSMHSIDAEYHRIYKTWHSLSRVNKQLALAELSRLRIEADEIDGSRRVVTAIRHLGEQIRISLDQ